MSAAGQKTSRGSRRLSCCGVSPHAQDRFAVFCRRLRVTECRKHRSGRLSLPRGHLARPLDGARKVRSETFSILVYACHSLLRCNPEGILRQLKTVVVDVPHMAGPALECTESNGWVVANRGQIGLFRFCRAVHPSMKCS